MWKIWGSAWINRQKRGRNGFGRGYAGVERGLLSIVSMAEAVCLVRCTGRWSQYAVYGSCTTEFGFDRMKVGFNESGSSRQRSTYDALFV